MWNPFKESIDGDEVLDQLQVDEGGSLNLERHKLGYWIRLICGVALLFAGFGVTLFTYIFGVKESFLRDLPYGSRLLLFTVIWLGSLVLATRRARKGLLYARITVGLLFLVGVVAAAWYIYSYPTFFGNGLSRKSYMRTEEFTLISCVYFAGLFTFPAVYYGWKYARSLQIPQCNEAEDWAWRSKTAQLGLRAWRFGAIGFTLLGIAFVPVIVNELEYYTNRIIRQNSVSQPAILEEVEDAIDEMPVELQDSESNMDEIN